MKKQLDEKEFTKAIYNVGIGNLDRFSVAEMVTAVERSRDAIIQTFENFNGTVEQNQYMKIHKIGIQKLYDQIIEKMEE